MDTRIRIVRYSLLQQATVHLLPTAKPPLRPPSAAPKTTPTTQTAPLASLAAPKPLVPWNSLRAQLLRVLPRPTPPLELGAYLLAGSLKALTPTRPRLRMQWATPLLPPIPLRLRWTRPHPRSA